MHKSYLETVKNHFQQIFLAYLSSLEHIPKNLINAINYSALQSGKRLRPLLVYTAGLALDAKLPVLDSSACAIELVHISSLIHDDLPGVDNDDWRRGQPTCHKKFDEATAIFAGDALLSLASTILCHDTKLTTTQRLAALQTLHENTGPAGMIGGQMLDMQLTPAQLTSSTDVATLENIYLLKTGALFRAGVKLGAIAANCEQASIFQALDDYAKFLGLAFQINDDISDKDSSDKPSYVSVTSLDNAQKKVQELYTQAIASLQLIPYDTTHLKNLASHILNENRF